MRGITSDAHPVIELRDVSQRVRGGELILHGISFTIRRGELVAIIGGSGTGKTTLLNTMSGLRLPTAGEVRRNRAQDRHGYVPQDDIIHLSLPLRRTLRYTAQLRLPAASTAEQTEHAVTDVLKALELTDRAAYRSVRCPAASASVPASPRSCSPGPVFSSWTSRHQDSTRPGTQS
jgi:ABC-type multidrug transport system ATPase subunit